MPNTKLLYNKKIRTVWYGRRHKDYYCLNDVVKALTNIKDAKNYLKQMRQFDDKLGKKWWRFVIPLEMDTAGGRQKVMCTDTEGLLFIIENMRSSDKTVLFKRWLKRRMN
ncbi:MAG: BRO family protein [Ignavibacteria bacterium]|nr:BRO family protein [Ignavibacteria bacterium]